MIFHLPNVVAPPMKGFQLNTVVVSENGWQHGVSNAFCALIDPGAKHTSVSKRIMRNILEKVRDKNGNSLRIVAYTEAGGVYGEIHKEPVYLLPHLFLGRIHLTNVTVAMLNSNNFDCLIGRSILHQCILTLDPESNSMTFDFRDSLKSQKALLDDLLPFEDVELFAEGGVSDLNTVNPDPLASDRH